MFRHPAFLLAASATADAPKAVVRALPAPEAAAASASAAAVAVAAAVDGARS